jgi:hypothetical protein
MFSRMHDSHSKLIELRDKILEKHSNYFSYAFSLPLCLEFMDKTVDKSGYCRILEIENLNFHETISLVTGTMMKEC